GVDDVAAARFGALAHVVISDRFASREVIGRVHMPVLIAHGDGDSVIPFAQGQHLFALANAPKVFVRMSGSDHATLVRDGIYDHIWPFLAANP
ncbi:MAG TPA: alpha/beta hydrolase, partial [Verrucomicrobiae bacterium]|nr:alpha/beta hydrolase [Verrucomicrobiae bacterium]